MGKRVWPVWSILLTVLLLAGTSIGVAQDQGKKAVSGQEAAKQASDALDAAKQIPKAAAVLKALGKSAGRNAQRRKAEAISTDAMMRLGELARAQEKICAAMQASPDKAQENQARAELVTQLTESMRALLEETVAPLWSELSIKALRAGRFDFGSVHARFEAAARAHERAVKACRGKPYAAGPDAAQLATINLRARYEAAFEAGVVHALGQHKSQERAEADLQLALSGFPSDRRAALEARLRAAITEAMAK